MINEIRKVLGFKKIKRFIQDYKKSLKPTETEEIADLILFRPIAFLFVSLVKNINFSPNYFTIISFVFGLLSAFYFSRGILEIAALFLFLMTTFDCADGQLARLKGTSSKYGKMLDNSVDIIAYIAIFGGIALHQYSLHSDPFVFMLAILAFVCLSMNVLFFDQFKNQYIIHVYNDYQDNVDPLAELYQHYIESRGLKRVANYIYYRVYRFETYIRKLGCLSDSKRHTSIFELKGSKPSKKLRELYKNTFRVSVLLWTFIGTSTHVFLVILLALLNMIELVLIVFICYSFIMGIVLLIYQNIAFEIYKKKMRMNYV